MLQQLLNLYNTIIIIFFFFVDSEDAKSLPPSSDNSDSIANSNPYLSDIYSSLQDNGRNHFPKETYLFCAIDGVDEPLLYRNTPRYEFNGNVHAEKKMIDELKKHTKVTESNSGPDLVITVYMNNSPCSDEGHDCKKRLKMFLKEYKRVHLTLYITSIHNVYRESCKRKGHSHPVSDEKHNVSSAELWNLMQHDRCQISAYSKVVWEKLFDLKNESKTHLEKYDENFVQKHDVSREDRDKLIGEDLIYIGKSSGIHS